MLFMQQQLIAGDTLNFATAVAQYPPTDGWVLKFRLVPRTTGGVAITLTSAADGTDHRVQAAASTTSGWAAGPYSWSSWVEKAGESYTVESGQITILPDPRQVAAGLDSRSQAEQALDAINAKLAGKASDAIERYTINGREIRYYPLADLIKLRSHFVQQVAIDRKAAGLEKSTGAVRRILVRTA
jgi:enamine deaminase RidA (YjgF/YER057c/UK114 family)